MPSQKIGRYEILRELGQGGMAAVYLARDPSFERQVAIKVLLTPFTREPQLRARFEREAKFIAALEHACIVPVYDYGEEGGQPFIVMRYMPGGTLADRMRGIPLPPEEIVPILQRLAGALDEAHRRNIIHRDLKPANVMFDAHGQAFLSDFGIAKLLEASATVLTGTTALIGTPAYMSPEQAVGDMEVDGRSDVYSLGVILYEMLSGHQPYKADTAGRLMLKHVTEPVPTLDVERLKAPPEWNMILARALAKNPDERYQTAGALAEAVGALWAATGGEAASPPVTPTPTPLPVLQVTPRPPTPDDLSPTVALPTPAEVSHPIRPARRLSPQLLALIGLPVMAALVGLAILLNLRGGGIGKPPATATFTLLRVQVAGAVAAPGVYQLPQGSIWQEAITAAGGPTARADLSRVNLAQLLVDGDLVTVPELSPSATTAPTQAPAPTPITSPGAPSLTPAPTTGTSAVGGKININTASAAELEALPGIGPVIAQRIVDYRNTYGPFTRIEDIVEVKGIGPVTFEEIKDLITVD